ncbi:MAG: hypothetical protein ACLPY1_12095 [Terracidiphilus sp.]
MNTIRPAFYARVSGEQQAAAHTIESQIAALSEHACADNTGCLLPFPPWSTKHFVVQHTHSSRRIGAGLAKDDAGQGTYYKD